MKILKPGKVEMRKFVCLYCGCVFVADETELANPTRLRCPTCGEYLYWDNGEPYEEPTQDVRMDSNRLARILFAMPMMDDCNSMANYLLSYGVTFREG